MSEAPFGSLPVGDIAAGALVGRALEAVALEGFTHQSLAHRNLEFSPALAVVGRYGMILTGLSPNRFAARHREHHAITTKPAYGVAGAIEHVFETGTGGEITIDPTDPAITFPGYSIDDDPLLKIEDGKVGFRNDPPLEAFIGKGDLRRFLPLAGVLTALGLGNRLAGREKPVQRAIGFGVGMMAGLTIKATITAFAEAQAEVNDGVLNDAVVLAPLRDRIRRHQEHHDNPTDIEAGVPARYRYALKFLQRVGLARPVAPTE